MFDLILLCLGVGISIILLLALDISDLKFSILAISPGLLVGFLVFPIPNYHNVLTVLRNVLSFYTKENYLCGFFAIHTLNIDNVNVS